MRVTLTVTAEVIDTFPANQEYPIRFRDEDDGPWSSVVMSWAGHPPIPGTVAQYRITTHLDTTRRMLATLHGHQDQHGTPEPPNCWQALRAWPG